MFTMHEQKNTLQFLVYVSTFSFLEQEALQRKNYCQRLTADKSVSNTQTQAQELLLTTTSEKQKLISHTTFFSFFLLDFFAVVVVASLI